MDNCPKCGMPSLDITHVQYGDEILKEYNCLCGYYDSEIISIADYAKALTPPEAPTSLPKDFSF